MTTTLSLEDQVRYLSTLTTRDHAGRHFTERYPAGVVEELETLGLVTINRPVHEPTGINYDQSYWSLEVTEAGQDLVDANPEYWDTAVTG